ncbi:uncharacterized protein VTP21DRAFT_43 [Calcarisporiella thermophila]|uniref:uncharacterized protein n=1 Tax=Calcarisporiella thermophila TaxID=911321 RepID=UPI00374230C8
MNYSFEGDYKSKRNISLSGVRTQRDRQNLLQQTQNERQAREAERLKQQAAVKIQAFYRGRRTAAQTCAQLRSFWSQNYSDYIRSPNNAEAISNLTRSLLFFYSPSKDDEKLKDLCTILKDKEKLIMPFINESEDEEIVGERWSRMLGRLGILIAKRIDEVSDRVKLEYIGVCMDVLCVVTNPSIYDKLSKMDASVDGKELHKDITNYLIRNELFAMLRNIITKYKPEEKPVKFVEASIQSISNCMRSFDQSQYAKDQTMYSLITNILTLPLLPNRVTIPTLQTFSIRLPFDSILAHLATVNLLGLKGETALSLLANLLAFGHGRVQRMRESTLMAYMKAILNVMVLLPDWYFPRTQGKSDNDIENDFDEDEDEEEKQITDPEYKIDSRMSKWLALAYDSTHIDSLLFPRFQKPDTSPALLGRMSSYVLGVMSVWPNSRSELIHKLTMAPSEGGSPVRLLYDVFLTGQLVERLQSKNILLSVFDDASFNDEWATLLLFSEILNSILLTTGDDEFFNPARFPLALSEIVNLSIITRNVAYTLFWNDGTALSMMQRLPNTTLLLGYLREVMVKLTEHIHVRDARRRFCPKDHYQITTTELNTSQFITAAIDEYEGLEEEEEGQEKLGIHTGPAYSPSSSSSAKRGHFTSSVASIKPRLAILHNLPQLIPFWDRVTLFRELVRRDRMRSGLNDEVFPVARVTIRRSHVVEDGYTYLNALGSKLKGRVAISFVDQFGLVEAGIDGGGVFKEFLTTLTRQAFDTNYGLFLSTKENLLYPNPQRYATEPLQLSYYEFLGRIIGKALYEGILVDVAFAGFFLTKWLGKQNYLDDLPSLDSDLYKGLIALKHYEGDIESDFAVNFTINDDEFGESRTIELIPNGANTTVTKVNRIRYLYLVAHYRLNTQIDAQCRAFFRGLSDLIDPKWLRMFDQQELQQLLGGASVPIDLADLKNNTVYHGYTAEDTEIQALWRVLEGFNDEQRRQFIKFVTSCARPPLLGFRELHPPFCIQNVGESDERLPTASTCMNLLKLPKFPNEIILREKLIYAINAEAGFDLS